MVDIVDLNGVVDISKPMSQKRFGELVGISQQAVSDLCQRGVLLNGQSCGAWLKSYCAQLREHAAGRAAKGDIDLVTERAFLAREQRISMALKNSVTRRQYGPIGQLEMGLSDVMAKVGSKLDTIPGELKRRSNVLSADDLDLVGNIIAEVRNDIADMQINWFEDMEIDDDIETSAVDT